MGWLEGLFQGLQATAVNEQIAARLAAGRQEPGGSEADGEAGYL